MASKIQFRRDTLENWSDINPVLAAGEIGYIFVKNEENEDQKYVPTNQYKLGDGITDWNNLPLFGFSGTFSDTLEKVDGEDPANTAVSKLVLISKFDSISSSIESLESELVKLTESIEGLQTTVERNTGNITALQTSVNENTDNIIALQTTVERNTGNITALQTSVNENTKNITTLQNKHQVLSKSAWNNGENAEDEFFYYIYEE